MNIQIIAFMGRQPEISLAEITSLVGDQAVLTSDRDMALVNTPLPTERMGGIIKLAEIIEQGSSDCSLGYIKDFLLKYCRVNSGQGKLTLGLSCYGVGFSSDEIQKVLKSVKSELKEDGQSLRTIHSQSATLSTAQVLYNQLTKEKKIEICICRINNNIYLARTSWIQDIIKYRRRDFDRPKRAPKIGMLPPKLAQIIINLATGGSDGSLLDPFCGTGVVLQEGLLMGYSVAGSDTSQRMLDYSQENLSQLGYKKEKLLYLEKADAQTYQWPEPVQFVASETYLGPPLRRIPSHQQLNPIVASVNELHEKFLSNLVSQLSSGQQVCLAVPAWRNQEGGFRHLPVLDALGVIGYNRLCFSDSVPLIYWRSGQFVGRELVIARKK